MQYKHICEVHKCVCAYLVAQLCPTLCNPIDCSLPGSSVHGILYARILEWIAILFSNRSSWHRDQTQVSCIAGEFFSLPHQGSPCIGIDTNTDIFPDFSNEGDFPDGPVVKISPSKCRGCGLDPWSGAKVPHAVRLKKNKKQKNQDIKQKKYCNKCNKDFKNGPYKKKS